MFKSLSEIDIKALCHGKTFFPSPTAWEDLVIYFLLPDRFSDGHESDYIDNDGVKVTNGITPLYREFDRNEATTEEEQRVWREAGGRWVGGKIKGITSKIGYLKRLGVSAIWVGPVYKQVPFQPTYHGYGIQNYLEIDEHLGTVDDFKALVEMAHQNGIYVIMDIILNHAGHVFSYEPEVCTYQDEKGSFPRWNGATFPVKGFNNAAGLPTIPFQPWAPENAAGPDDAVWPGEFQNPETFTQKGRMVDPDNYPEYIDGDFEYLKDLHLGTGSIDNYSPSSALKSLCEVYKYWIALTDLDGFRMDTVKHMDKGAVRYFAWTIHEFAQSIGKENFYLIGEISGPREYAFHTLEETGLDAALGLDGVQDKMEYLVKGERNPQEYFDLFTNSMLVGKESHAWFRNKVVASFDDHDQIRKGRHKARFCSALEPGQAKLLMLNVSALNAFSLGIPCIYYGSEQCFDGEGDNDQYIREAMFGGDFGPFRSRHRHCFNEDEWVYRE
ncbi:MAG TPA: alpha-amylase family glycosyl hydrolase, partial [Bacillota bacterium]|nr:alpha-amylase family glycosyl hydrolase [Bacillota bacterium]